MWAKIRHYRRWLVPLVLTLFLLPALVPLVQTTSMPCTHDDVFHVFRFVAMRAMARHGWIFSRWVPNLALGYGYPFFNYREPLPYLVGTGLFAAGVPMSLVLGVLYTVSLVGAAWGAYVLARDLFGSRAAWISAVAYGLGPYVLLDPLRRGNMPESVALALIPWLFVFTRRVILRGGLGNVVATVGLLVTLFLSHNISGLLLAPFLGLYVLLLAWIYRDRRGWPYVFAAVAAAVLLAAWFWLPALTERDWVQLHLSRTTRNNNFRYNFATWREILLTVPPPYDPAYLNPPMRVYLGVGQAVLAILGVGVGAVRLIAGRHRAVEDEADGERDRRHTARQRRQAQAALIGLFAVAAVAYLWMSTSGSLPVWEAVPLLSFVQFPWRLVGRALLPASLLAGLAFEPALGSLLGTRFRVLRQIATYGGLFLALASLVVLSWPDTYPPKGMCGVEAQPDLEDLYALERSSWPGMDPESSYFPIWVEEHPDDTALAASFTAGTLPARFDAATLPEGGEVVAASYEPLAAEVRVRAPTSFRARWLGLYFPGWQVRVDGVEVAVAPEDDTGLMTFTVPAGEHHIEVVFTQATMARRVGLGLTGLGVVVLGATLIVVARRADSSSSVDAERFRIVQAKALVWGMAAVALALSLIRLQLVGQTPTPWMRQRIGAADSAGATLPEATTSLGQPFGDGLTLLGATVGAEQIRGNEELPVTLLWQARDWPSRAYRMVVLLKGPDDQIWSPAGAVRPRGYEPPPETDAWAARTYAYDPHLVRPLAGTPPGTYRVVVSLFDAETLAPVSVLDAAGAPAAADLTLGEVQVTAPPSPYALSALNVPEDATLKVCGSIGLWAMEVDRAAGAPGDIAAVRWVWEALAAPKTALSATLRLRDETGDQVTSWSLPPAATWWPTDAWRAGERWVGQHVVRLPGGLESGAYTLEVGLPTCEVALASAALEVVAPERVWTVPEDLLEADVVLGGEVRLAGYAVAPEAPAPGQEIDVRLAWQALTETRSSYRVFLHLLDGEGRVVAQDDGEPAGWTRPTTGWAAEEVVSEVRSLRIPEGSAPGRYTVRVGLYLPDGERLLTSDGDDGRVLATVQVQE